MRRRRNKKRENVTGRIDPVLRFRFTVYFPFFQECKMKISLAVIEKETVYLLK